jgi:hypothetical protein
MRIEPGTTHLAKPRAAATNQVGRAWTTDEIVYLKRHYLTSTAAQIAAALKRPIPSLRAKISALGLTKATLRQERTGRAGGSKLHGTDQPSAGGADRRRPSWKKPRAPRRTSKRTIAKQKVTRRAVCPVRPIFASPR